MNESKSTRLAQARDHYRTRTERRKLGQSQADLTAYDLDGKRRPARQTLELRQHMVRYRRKSS